MSSTDKLKEARVTALMAELSSLLSEPDSESLADAVAKGASSTLRRTFAKNVKGYPYYREKFAKELAVFLDRQIENKKITEFHKHGQNISTRTLWHKLYQSWQWLIDNGDPKYAAMWETHMLVKGPGCVRIVPRANTRAPLEAVELDTEDDRLLKLQNRISDFLVDDDSAALFDEHLNLPLKEGEIDDLRRALAPVMSPQLVVQITPIRVRVLKRNKLNKTTDDTTGKI